MMPHPPKSTLFPFTTLFRTPSAATIADGWTVEDGGPDMAPKPPDVRRAPAEPGRLGAMSGPPSSDRKSTRLNSSHVRISYAVFCLEQETLHAGNWTDHTDIS